MRQFYDRKALKTATFRFPPLNLLNISWLGQDKAGKKEEKAKEGKDGKDKVVDPKNNNNKENKRDKKEFYSWNSFSICIHNRLEPKE